MSYTNLNEIDSSTFSFEVDSNSYLIEITTTGAKQDFDMGHLQKVIKLLHGML